jgi:hypothetical protein
MLRVLVMERRVGALVVADRVKVLVTFGMMMRQMNMLVLAVSRGELRTSYMEKKIGNSGPRFGMNFPKSVWLVLLPKGNVFTAKLKSVPSVELELVL